MHISDIIRGVVSDIIKRRDTPDFPTNLQGLDEAIWGLHKTEVLVVGGRPGDGKTSLCLQLAYEMSIKHRVVFLSLEMTKEQLVERIIAYEYMYDYFGLRKGIHKKVVQGRQDEICDKLSKHKLLIIDDMGRTPLELENCIKELSPKPDVIFIDHLQQISVRKGNRLEALDEYVRFLKTFAMKEDISVVLASQLNRGAEEDSRPHLHYIKGCGSVEEVADCVVLIWRQDNQTSLLIEKQRHGPTGKLEVNFLKEFSKFTDKSFRQEPKDIQREKISEEEIEKTTKLFGGEVI